MKKQTYLKPQIEVELLDMSESLLLTASDITTLQSADDIGLIWEEDPDNSGEAI